MSLGFDLSQGLDTALKDQAKALGYTVKSVDANWNVESALQAVNAFIDEKPDVLILQPLDMQTYNRIIPKAMAAGINIVQMEVKSAANGDAFVGPDFGRLGSAEVEKLADVCGKDGKNGKIAIITGMVTDSATIDFGREANAALAKHPELHLVSTQASDFDATKAHALTTTILKQNPDLCGIMGIWDGDDVGTAAAVREAGMQGKVFLATNGGGAKANACVNIENGNYSAYLSYDLPGMTRDLNDVVKMLLETHPKPGSAPFTLYAPMRWVTKDTLASASCWAADDLKGSAPVAE
jgi:ABC-type sugar transport system substrate-binding protein